MGVAATLPELSEWSLDAKCQQIQFVDRHLKQEEAVKKTQRPSGKFPFKWNQGGLLKVPGDIT